VRAHAAVVTLPLGVLKAGSVAFSPPLPECVYLPAAASTPMLSSSAAPVMLFHGSASASTLAMW